jgi:acyl-coenzyme A synthetase/AMP-(fatty) acid ligase
MFRARISTPWSRFPSAAFGRADDREVAPGKIGELLIRAPTMMHGYWARPDLNRTSFLVREPLPNFRKRFYRTGDLVRQRGDGNLLFLGRKDRQVKVRGYRVELDEVENVIGALEEVSEAAAVALLNAQGETSIVAVVTVRDRGAVDVMRLRQRSAERLPQYAVPQRIEVVDGFPRTGSGKIDRRALAERLQEPSAAAD